MAEHSRRQGDTPKAREIAGRLLDMASKCEAHKYIAVAHKLMAQIAIADGSHDEAESEFAGSAGRVAEVSGTSRNVENLRRARSLEIKLR